jgi:hypothetical protein
MNVAAQISTGGRQLVLENGADLLNSSDEDSENEDHEEVLGNMYTNEMDPKKGPQKLTRAEVARQRAVAAVQREMFEAARKAKSLPRSQSPGPGSSDDDGPNGSDMISCQTKGCMRPNKNKRRTSTPQVGPAISTEADRSQVETETPLVASVRLLAGVKSGGSRRSATRPESTDSMHTRRSSKSTQEERVAGGA